MTLRTPGRGAGFNPPNRFEARSFEPVEIDVPCEDDEPRTLKTTYLRDVSKSILSSNDSPDLGFAYSMNPYRGCTHGCSYCLSPSTPILYSDMSWKPIGDVQVGEVLVGFDEFPPAGGTRKFRRSVVEKVWWSRKPTMRLVTDHTEVVTTAEHRWLQARSFRWSRTDQLTPGRRLRLLPMTPDEPIDEDYRRGFLAGFFDAEGSNERNLRMTQLDVSVLERVQHFGREMNIDAETVRVVEPGPLADVIDIQTSTGTFFAAGLATHNCYARPTHEYLGFSAGLDFESKIVVKENAPELLRAELSHKSWKPQLVVLSGNTDCYQPVERTLGITRRCLEVFLEFRNPVGVITKNALVTRDVDVLAELAKRRCAGVTVSVTTLDPELARRMEPRTSTPARRLEAIRVLADAGIPVRVNVAPVIPGLTDEEIPAILAAARAAGAVGAGTTIVRLSGAVKPIFLEWLEREYPLRAPKVIARLKDIRGETLTDSRFGKRQSGEGEIAAAISALFRKTCAKLGLNQGDDEGLDVSGFSKPGEKQGELF